VNADEMKARYHNGVLEISMPAPASMASKKVPSEVSGEAPKQIAA
jgi:HSP20 family molecular chaperone IbpA